MSRTVRGIAFAALLLLPGSASAQDSGKVGVFMGYPNLGLIFHVSDKVAIRPEISFSYGSTETTSLIGAETDTSSWAVGFGASALFYLNDADRLKTYVGPQFEYNRTSLGGELVISDLTGDSYGFGGLFGAQYSLSDRFSVFGELGIGYTRTSSSSDFTGIEIERKSSSWGSRSAVGVILYF